jgi:hypothetical protein
MVVSDQLHLPIPGLRKVGAILREGLAGCKDVKLSTSEEREGPPVVGEEINTGVTGQPEVIWKLTPSFCIFTESFRGVGSR